jgi:hypothetical protein
MVNLQTITPGRWDLMFSNNKGSLYVEALVGKNPLGRGYSYCAMSTLSERCQGSF